MVTTTSGRAKQPVKHEVMSALRALEMSAYTDQVAHAQDRDKDEKRERAVALAAVVLSTIVGASVFASLAANPHTALKILVGSLSLLAAIIAAVNEWGPFMGQSKAHSASASEAGAIKLQASHATLLLSGDSITPGKAHKLWLALSERLEAARRNGPGTSNYAKAEKYAIEKYAKDAIAERAQPS